MKDNLVLVVDDEESARVGLCSLLGDMGYRAEGAADGRDALEKVRLIGPAVVIVDLVMPGMSGMELLRALSEELAHLTVIILTAQGNIDSAVEAMKEGASDYLTKPVEIPRLRVAVAQGMDRVARLKEVRQLKRELAALGSFGKVIGTSPTMRTIYRLIELAAPTTAPILISGESGTGKELVARTIHELSPRREAPFVAVNCAAIPATLLEAEIFGHEKGAFTGATVRRAGYFEMADGGTLFLDEIAEMPPALQGKLLRVIEDNRVRRLGGRDEFPVDVRVVAACNQELDRALKDGVLRSDLYYRINVFQIELPSLRERREDILPIARQFIEQFSKQNGKEIRGIDARALKIMEEHPWPGNVRELKNVLERAVIVCKGEQIGTEDLPDYLIRPRPVDVEPPQVAPGITIEEAENRLIVETLKMTGNNKTRAAQVLGISLKTLHNKLNRMAGLEEEAEP